MRKLYYVYRNGADTIISDDGEKREIFVFNNEDGLSYDEVLNHYVQNDLLCFFPHPYREISFKSVDELVEGSKILATKELDY